MRRPALPFALIALAALSCRDKADQQKRPAPTLATAAASSEPARDPDDPRPTPPVTAGSPGTAAPATFADRPQVGKKPRAPIEDGAVSVRLVFERAQKAFAEGDDATVFHCVAEKTRKSWLGSMVFSGEFAATGRNRAQGPRRAALDELRAILDRYSATLSVDERLAGLNLDELQAALMRKVNDPTGLFADLLAWSARQGARTDPMQALSEPWGRDGARAGDAGLRSFADAQGAPNSGIAGVLGRLAAGAPLGEMKVVADTATAPIKRSSTAASAADVQRFVRQNGAWFLDE